MVLQQQRTSDIDYYLKFLPERVSKAIAFTGDGVKKNLTEIRLRVNSPLSLTVNRENMLIDSRGRYADIKTCVNISRQELDLCVSSLCDGSYHAQANNIKNGYIITGAGYRIGVCGDIIYTGGADFIIDEITSVNMRVNRFVLLPDCPVLDIIKENGLAGMLIYSPPSEGKTTLLRFIAAALSKGLYGLKKYRTALIDERREIYIKDKMGGGLLDIFYGYKKSDGIDCATRTLNPDVIICDEIGGLEDTRSILSAQNSGVPLIATTHAGSFEQLKRKPNINNLIENGVFEYFVGISLDNNNIIKYIITK